MLEVIFSILGTILGPFLGSLLGGPKSIKKRKKRYQKQDDFNTDVPEPPASIGGSNLGRDGPRGARVCRAL